MPYDNKLELKWVGKDEPIRVEPRLLIEDPTLSYSSEVHGEGINDNILIHGDNLLALKALEKLYAGQVKCIYIDPPYNTGYAFEHYDDNLEHSQWLNLMRSRLQILKNLLMDDGSIWISIDDDEGHYLKVMCDEIYGRQNFVNTIIWEKKFSPQSDAKWLSDNHDFILVYAKNKQSWRPNLLPRNDNTDKRYSNPDNDPRGPWASSDLTVRTYNQNCDYPITTPGGKVVVPSRSRCWGVSRERFNDLVADNRIWFGVNGRNIPELKRFLAKCNKVLFAQQYGNIQKLEITRMQRKNQKSLTLKILLLLQNQNALSKGYFCLHRTLMILY